MTKKMIVSGVSLCICRKISIKLSKCQEYVIKDKLSAVSR